MRIPLSWIREYTSFPADGTAEDLMAALVTVGLEEEDVHRPADELSGPIVVGEVLEKTPEPQKNGKTINWCQVRVVPEGQSQQLQGEGISPDGVQGVVCGADNFSVGDKVVVTLPGAVLPGDFRITPRKTYGHVSAGMIASVRELGIGEDHDGILVLSRLGLNPDPGTDALALLGLDDHAAEINVTPDRGYAFSMRGVAREYSHATGTPFTDPADLVNVLTQSSAGRAVELADDAPIYGTPGCGTFVARRVTGVDVNAPTPPWMASRLRLAGLRSISLPVDISNYVMWELGQPNHFYDAEKVDGTITVRRASAGETMVTLDEKERTLSPEDLLIADESGAIGIAGVMGGARTEVDDSTTTILIEAAHFDPITVSRSKRRHKLPSEASKRNERGVDPLLPEVAAQRAVDLLVELAGGEDTGELTVVGTPSLPAPILLDVGLAARVTGVDYELDQIVDSLRRIGAEVELRQDDRLEVAPPSWRPDLTIPEALVEEVARLIGYDKIPSRVPQAPVSAGLSAEQRRRRQLLNAVAAAGFTETLSYPFCSEEANELFGRPESAAAEAAVGGPAAGEASATGPAAAMPMVRLANPIASQYPALRTSVLPGLLDTLRRNVSRGFHDLTLFEAGQVFLPDAEEPFGTAGIPGLGAHPGEDVLAALEAGIPAQPMRLATALCGAEPAAEHGQAGRARDWADAIDSALTAAESINVALTVRQGRHQAFHPGRTAELVLGDGAKGAVVGYAGELHPQVLEAWNLPARTVAAELDLSAVIGTAQDQVEAAPFSTYPPATQDVSLVVAADLAAADLRETLREGAGELLEDIELFDVYAGEHIASGKKSLAFALRFRAEDRTLTAEEASAARDAAVSLAVQRHGAELRG